MVADLLGESHKVDGRLEQARRGASLEACEVEAGFPQ